MFGLKISPWRKSKKTFFWRHYKRWRNEEGGSKRKTDAVSMQIMIRCIVAFFRFNPRKSPQGAKYIGRIRMYYSFSSDTLGLAYHHSLSLSLILTHSHSHSHSLSLSLWPNGQCSIWLNFKVWLLDVYLISCPQIEMASVPGFSIMKSSCFHQHNQKRRSSKTFNQTWTNPALCSA